MNSHDAHQQRLFMQINAEPNPDTLETQGQEMADMEMQTDFRAGSPCRQAATEIMEDISMETGMDDESYRQDMINVFPGHPALPQQTHNLQGQRIMNPPQQPGAPGATIIGNHGPDTNLAMFQGPTGPQTQPMMSDQSLGTEPDWITQMLDQVQKVGLWNDPIPEEPSRVFNMPEATGPLVSEPAQAETLQGMDPIPFYKANMESLLTSSGSSGLKNRDQQMPPPPNPPHHGMSVNTHGDFSCKTDSQGVVPTMPSMDPVRAFSHEGGMGVIGQNQSTQSQDYIHLIKNALNVPGRSQLDVRPPHPLPLERNRTVSLELSNDGMKEVLASRQKSLNDGPFRPPTKAPSRHALAGMRSLDSNVPRPILQQSKLQLELGLAADAPIDLRKWGYGGPGQHPGDVSMQSNGKRSLSSEGLHAIGSSAEVGQSHLLHSRPEPSGCTTADSVPSGVGPSRTIQSADYKQHSLNSGSLEHVQQASDRKSGLSADEVTRLESLERYREKKRRRLYTKTIRYHKRKVNADARKRHKGRFVKAETSQGMSLNTKDSGEQITDPGHRGIEQSLEASDLQTV